MIMTFHQMKPSAELDEAKAIIQRMPHVDNDHRTVTKVAKLVMLNGNVFSKGEYYEPKIKNLGAGVYRVWFAPKVY